VAENDPTKDDGTGKGIDLNDPAIKAAIEQELEARVQGLKNTNQALKKEKTEWQKRHQEFLESVGGEEGFSNLIAIREKFSAQEDQELLKQGRIDDLVSKRVQSVRQSIEQDKAKAMKIAEEAKKEAEKANGQLASFVRESLVRQAFSKSQFIPEAAEDAVLMAERFVRVDPATREAVVVDEYGQPRTNAEGKTLSVAEWVEDLAARKPYWLKPSSGAGAAGSKGRPGTITNRSQMTAKEKSDYISQHGVDQYLALPLK